VSAPLSCHSMPPQESEEPHYYLLALPIEVQLRIYELALISPCLLLNYPCCDWQDSVGVTWRDDGKYWDSGKGHAPHEPGLTRTCRLIRKLTIPIIYQENHSLTHHCLDVDIPTAVKWLDDVG